MAFDPSVIADIGSSGPDIYAAKAKAFQLKDMIDTQQLSALKLAGEKSQMAEQGQFKQIMAGSDISSDKGLAEAAEKLNKAGMPDKAMGLKKYADDVASGRLEQQIKMLELHGKVQDEVVNRVGGIVTQLQPMSEAKKPD